MNRTKAMRYIIAVGVLLFVGYVQLTHGQLTDTDLAGTPRAKPQATMGALEVPDGATVPPAVIIPPAIIQPPALPGAVVLKAIYTAELMNADTRSVDDPWDHCAGTNKTNICRVVMVFDVSRLKGQTLASVKLALYIQYVAPGMEAATYTLVRYDGDPRDDNNCLAWSRADGWRYVKSTTKLRSTGTKMLYLSTTSAVVDILAAANAGRPWVVALRSNDERTPDRFVGVGRQAGQAPELWVVISVTP